MDFDPANFSPISRLTTKWNKMYRHTPRGVQLAHMFNRASLRNSLKIVRAWEPEYAIVAHSPWLCVEGSKQVDDLLNSAFDWLTPRSFIVEAMITVAQFSTLLLVILPIHALIVLSTDIVYPRLVKQVGSP